VNSTSARTVTFRGSGDTLLTGGVSVAGAAVHGFSKEGTGLMAIQGNASNYSGDASVTGTLRISDVGALNASSSGWLTFGANTANLEYVGAGQTWSDKVIAVNQSNGGILANGTGALVLARNVANTGAAARYLVLGGASSAANELQGILHQHDRRGWHPQDRRGHVDPHEPGSRRHAHRVRGAFLGHQRHRTSKFFLFLHQ